MRKRHITQRRQFVVAADINGFTVFLCSGLRYWTFDRPLAHHFNFEQYAEEAREKAVKWFSHQVVNNVRVLPLG